MIRNLIAAALLLLCICGAGTVCAAEWTPVTLTDDGSAAVTISSQPQRIISLSPANTEILFALGLNDSIVGVTEYCTYPAEAMTKEKIGGYSEVNVERVVSLSPDLIFAGDGTPADSIEYLRQLGCTVIYLQADTIQRTIDDILLAGKATGKTAEAEALTDSMQTELNRISTASAGLSRPSVLHCMAIDPLWVSGNSTFQDEMIAAAGGVNAAADTEGWSALTIEKFLTLDPDIVIVDSGSGMGVGSNAEQLKAAFLTEPRMQSMKAVKNNAIYTINADIIDRGGPRITEGVQAIASITHPEVFGPSAPTAAPTTSPGFLPLLVLAAAGAAVILRRR